MSLGTRWPSVSCEAPGKNEGPLLGICGLAGSYRRQSPGVMKTVLRQSRTGSDFRDS